MSKVKRFFSRTKGKICAALGSAALVASTVVSASAAEPTTSNEIIIGAFTGIINDCLDLVSSAITLGIPILGVFIGWKLAKRTLNSVAKV